MLSNEEKKALKELTEIKELVEEDLKYEDYNVTATLDQIDLESLVIILNLIEKQQKEIEELKDESKEYQIGFAQGCYEKDLDWKDKIKAKIEYYEKIDNPVGKKVLQSLLEKE